MTHNEMYFLSSIIIVAIIVCLHILFDVAATESMENDIDRVERRLSNVENNVSNQSYRESTKYLAFVTREALNDVEKRLEKEIDALREEKEPQLRSEDI